MCVYISLVYIYPVFGEWDIEADTSPNNKNRIWKLLKMKNFQSNKQENVTHDISSLLHIISLITSVPGTLSFILVREHKYKRRYIVLCILYYVNNNKKEADTVEDSQCSSGVVVKNGGL